VSEDRFEMLLGPFVLGELTDEEERELERHLEECPACQNDLDELRSADGMLRSAAAGPPPELKDWVLARVRSERRHASGGRWRIWLPVAAALVVVALLSFGVLRSVTGPSDGLALTATSAAPQSGGELRGEQVGDNLKVELDAWGLPEPEDGGYYEMWYAKANGGRISCGTFTAHVRAGQRRVIPRDRDHPGTRRRRPRFQRESSVEGFDPRPLIYELSAISKNL